MLTDAILREATAEADRFLLSTVPEDGEPHVFSKRFERKMSKLIRRVNHPIRYQVMRVAAAVALVIVTLFGAVMAVSPEARATVVGWIKETFGIYVHYSNDHTHADNSADSDDNTNVSAGTDSDDDTQEPTKYEYHLVKIPAGYQELRVTEKKAGKTYLYIDNSGNILQFTYAYGTKNSSLFIETENYEHHSVFVDVLMADIYLAHSENESNVIVWENSHTDMIFQIFAKADQTELIEMAQSVEVLKQ